MKLKLFFLDLETTGTRFWKNGIHQMSGCIDIDGKTIESFDFKVRPNEAALIEEEALKIAGVTQEQVLQYPHMSDIKNQLDKILVKHVDKFKKDDKFFIVGFRNSSFDDAFFRAFFTQCGDNYFGSYFWANTIDVSVLASEKLKHVRHTMTDFKLSTVADFLGIKVDESRLHDAMYDIELTREIYYILTKASTNE